MRSDKLGSQIEKKVKPGFLLSLMFMFPELNTTKSDLTTFTSKTQVFCRPEWAKGGGSMKMNFDNFQIHIWRSQLVRAQKLDEKNGIIC